MTTYLESHITVQQRFFRSDDPTNQQC